MFTIIASTAALAISYSVAKLTFPIWMPDYQVYDLTIKDVTLSSLFWSGELSMTMVVGVLVENSFFVGSELHASQVDIYYPDWDGELQYVADLAIIDSKPNDFINRLNQSDAESELNTNEIFENLQEVMNDINSTMIAERNPRTNVTNSTLHGVSMPSATTVVGTRHPQHQPYLKLPARQSTYKHDNIVTIHNLEPKTYLNGLKDIINDGGKINLGSTAVFQVKTSNVPLTIELMCNHQISLISFPIRISKRDCVLEGIVAGWGDLKGRGEDLKRDAKKRFSKTGSIFKNGNSKTKKVEKTQSFNQDLRVLS